MTSTDWGAVAVLVAAFLVIVYFGRSFGRRHRQHQARMLHPSNPTPHRLVPWGNSGWFVIAAILVIVVLILVVAS